MANLIHLQIPCRLWGPPGPSGPSGLASMQLSHGSGMGPVGPATQPRGHLGFRGGVEGKGGKTQTGLAAEPGGGPLGHVTLAATQAQPCGHLFPPPRAVGTPGGSKGLVCAHARLVKQRVEVVMVVGTTVLVT